MFENSVHLIGMEVNVRVKNAKLPSVVLVFFSNILNNDDIFMLNIVFMWTGI